MPWCQCLNQVTWYSLHWPAIVKMSGYSKMEENDKEWYSDPFYTHIKGYEMCLTTDAAGDGSGRGTHLSVFLILMKGSHDDELIWPLRESSR